MTVFQNCRKFHTSEVKRTTLKLKLFFLLLILCGLCSSALFAQQPVNGRVTSGDTALSGVSVNVKGSAISTMTDENGTFTIRAAPGSTLIFSSVGYVNQEIPVSGRTLINVQLAASAQGLDEVIVTGYSSQRRKDITGSVAVVDMDALESLPVGSAAQALQGQASGVTVITSGLSGARPDIRVRGISSFGDSYPLVLIDGVEGNLNDIAATDIESIQVLKDAGSAAIYGVRGSNGVIVVTTKKGKSGAPVFSYDAFYGVTYPLRNNPLNLMNSEEFMQAALIADPNEPMFANGMPDYFFVSPNGVGAVKEGNPLVDPSNYYFDPKNPVNSYLIQKVNKEGTDWYRETSRNAPRMNHTMSVRGGSDKSNYMFSLGYYDEKGTLINTQLKRYNARINTSFRPMKFFRFGENLNILYKDNPIIPINAEGGQFSPLGLHRDLIPLIPVYDIMGNWGGTRIGPNLGTQRNPVAFYSSMGNNINNTWQAIGNFFAEIDFLRHFTLRSSIGGILNYTHGTNLYVTEYSRSEFFSNPNRLSENSSYASRWVWTNTLEFKKTFGEHTLNVLAGVEAIKNYGRNLGGSREDYIVEEFDYLTLSSGVSNIINSSTAFEDALYSQFVNLNYGFANKYLIGATVRRDGSSRFGSEKRFGTFPSVSAGWRLSNEGFMSGLTWIDDLKLRGSYGVLGSQNNVNPENQFDLYGSSFSASYYDINGTSSSILQGFYNARMGNVMTGWERNIVSNVGLDLSMFNFLTINFELYKKSIDGLLFPLPLPAFVGGAIPPTVNIGDIQNKGFDLSATVRGNITRDLRYSFGANIGSYQNKVVDVPGPGYFDGSFNTRNQEGQSIGSFFGYEVLGLFQSADEVSKSPTQDGAAPGRFRYRDANGDGVINPDDRLFIGDPNPDFVYGFNLGLNYKHFDLSAILYGSQGNDVYNTIKEYTHRFSGYESNKSRDLLNAWTPDNTNTPIPKIEANSTFSTWGAMNSFRIDDGSFFRLRSLMVGFTVPASAFRTIGVSRMRIYLQGTNLFTITKYPGYDPEIGGSSALFGVDTAPYPANQMSLLAGLNLTF